MKLLRLLTICVLLASCSDNKTNTDDKSSVEKTVAEKIESLEAPKGTLYLESYIVGGLSIGWLWLGDDGNFVKNPVRGADPIDIAAEKQLNAANTGTYTKTGDQISVTYTSGKTETWKMEYIDGKLNTIDGWFATAQKGMPDGYKLNGPFTANFKVGYVSKQQTYNFKGDGTYTLGSMATVNVKGAGGTATSEAEKGTYHIQGNTIHLKMNNGDESVALIGVIPGDKPSVIINYTMFMQ